MSSWYDPALRRDDEFSERRSTSWTVLYSAIALVGAVALVILILNFADLQKTALDSLENLSRRNAMQTRVAPLAGVILAAAAFGLGTFHAIFRSRVWVRKETGNRLRHRAGAGFAGGADIAPALESRFRTGDPRGYAPLPESQRAWNVAVDIWVVPEDAVAYIGITVGRRRGTAQYRPLMRFRELPFDGLVAALDNGITRPLPDSRNPLALAGIPYPGDAGPSRPGSRG